MYSARGVFYPSPETTLPNGQLYKGPKPRLDEIPDLIRGLKGKPVHWMHDLTRVIGKVTNNVVQDEHGAVYGETEIDTQNPNGAKVVKLIQQGKATGFSIGCRLHDRNAMGEVGKIEPIEVSICPEGAFDGSYIYMHGQGKTGKVNVNKISQAVFKHNQKSTPKPKMDIVPDPNAAAQAEETPMLAGASKKRERDEDNGDEVERLRKEVYDLRKGEVARILKSIYDILPENMQKQESYKASLANDVSLAVKEGRTDLVYAFAAQSNEFKKFKETYADLDKSYKQLSEKVSAKAKEETPQSRVVNPDERRKPVPTDWKSIAADAMEHVKLQVPLTANAAAHPLTEGITWAEIDAEARAMQFVSSAPIDS